MWSEGLSSGLGDRLVLRAESAYPDPTDHLVAAFQRNAAGEDHNAALIGHMDAEKLLPRLAVLRKILCRDIEGPCSPGFIDRDVDAADPGVIHPDVGHEVATAVHDGDVHGLADFDRLLLGGGNNFS